MISFMSFYMRHLGVMFPQILPSKILMVQWVILFGALFQSRDVWCQDSFNYWYANAIVAAVPRAAHAVSMATLLFPPADHAGRRALVRIVAVSSYFTLLVIGARVDLAKVLALLVRGSVEDASGSVGDSRGGGLPLQDGLDGIVLGPGAALHSQQHQSRCQPEQRPAPRGPPTALEPQHGHRPVEGHRSERSKGEVAPSGQVGCTDCPRGPLHARL